MKIAVAMLNLGGPGSPAEVRPFLEALFSDREIIRFPGGRIGQRLFARWLARRKAPESRANYEAIGGGSPLLAWTERQGAGMARLVERAYGVELLPLPCMRYWEPSAETALRRALAWGAEHVVAMTQYPHFSTTTSGSSLRDFARTAARLRVPVPISTIDRWGDEPEYVEAVADCVRDGLAAIPPEHRETVRVLYSAHSLPVRFVEAGDPYPDEIRRTVAAVHRAAGLDQSFEIAWQSKVGPVRWLQPSSIDRIRALPREGVRDVVVVPISFVNDHIETLQELDLQLAAEAERSGVRTFVRAPSLNVRPAFLRALAAILGRHLARSGLVSAPAGHASGERVPSEA